ncbi:MAG: hypothetical protein ACYS8W_00090 [Planctomycetota bacterium]|jgi:WD40 repeat protein
MKRRIFLIIVLALGALIFPTPFRAESGPAVKLILKKKKLFKLERYENLVKWKVSPDGKKLAIVVGIGDRKGWDDFTESRVLCFSEKGSEIDAKYKIVREFRWTGDSRLAFLGRKANGKMTLVLDGKEGPEYDNIHNLIFGPGGKGCAYIAEKKSEPSYSRCVVHNCKEGEWYEHDIVCLSMSGDGEKCGYYVNAFDSFAVVDGKKGKKYRYSLHKKTFVLNQTGDRYAFAVREGNSYLLVTEAGETKKYKEIERPVFSPDGKRLAYLAYDGENSILVVDGEEVYKAKSRRLSLSKFLFSPDSKHWAVVVKKKEEQPLRVIVDGKEHEGHSVILDMVFSHDGKRFAYKASDKEILEGAEFIVLDGKKEESHKSVLDPIFSPDGKRFAYLADDNEQFGQMKKGGLIYPVVDGKKWKSFGFIAHVAARPTSYKITNTSMTFSPDGRHLAYYTSRRYDFGFFGSTDSKCYIIVDEKQSKAFDRIALPPNRIVWDSPDTFHFMAALKGVVYLVSAQVK